jgi:hypothetical protein
MYGYWLEKGLALEEVLLILPLEPEASAKCERVIYILVGDRNRMTVDSPFQEASAKFTFSFWPFLILFLRL